MRRSAQVAAEHGLLPWRVQALFGLGSHEHTRGDPVAPSLLAARELALEAGLLVVVVQIDLMRANAASARRRSRAPPSRSCAAPPSRPDGCGSPPCRRWPSSSPRSTPGSRATSTP